jgi:hypothetical protein
MALLLRALGPGLDEIDPPLVRRCASGIAVVPSALANHQGSHKEALGVYAVVTPGLIWLSCSSKVRAGSFCIADQSFKASRGESTEKFARRFGVGR